MRPRLHPVDELALALAAASGPGADWRKLKDDLLRPDPARALTDLANDLRARAGAGEAQILIPIDQAEELFGVADPDEVRRFLEILSKALAESLPFMAIMAIRSDFLGQLQSAAALTARFEECLDPCHWRASRRSSGGQHRQEDIVKELAAKGPPPKLLEFQATSASGSYCATVAEDAPDIVDVWSAAPLSHIARMTHTRAFYARIALSNDAGFIAMTDRGESGGPNAGALRVRNLRQEKDVLRQTSAGFVAFSPDNRLFATTEAVWRLPGSAQGEATLMLPWPGRPKFVVFNRSGRHVATRSDSEGEVQVWDLSNGSVQSANAPAGNLLALDDDGGLIVIMGDGALLWDLQQGVELARLQVQASRAAFGERDVIVLAYQDEAATERAVVFALQPASAALAGLWPSA
jgi:hypothetical protein